jgi:hypothetical protein
VVAITLIEDFVFFNSNVRKLKPCCFMLVKVDILLKKGNDVLTKKNKYRNDKQSVLSLTLIMCANCRDINGEIC